MKYCYLILSLLLLTTCSLSAQKQEFFQLKTYVLDTESQVMRSDQYLRDAYIPALKRNGINRIGVFKRRPDDSSGPKETIVLIPLQDLNQLARLERSLSADKVYQKKAQKFFDAPYDNPAYNRVESVLLEAFEAMPILKPSPLTGPRSERIYELRSYESPTDEKHLRKVEMFNNESEVELFERLGFNAVFYGRVLSGSRMPNLMYLTTFPDQVSRDAHWDAFRNDPQWLSMKVKPYFQNTVSVNETKFLYPTVYSDY